MVINLTSNTNSYIIIYFNTTHGNHLTLEYPFVYGKPMHSTGFCDT